MPEQQLRESDEYELLRARLAGVQTHLPFAMGKQRPDFETEVVLYRRSPLVPAQTPNDDQYREERRVTIGSGGGLLAGSDILEDKGQDSGIPALPGCKALPGIQCCARCEKVLRSSVWRNDPMHERREKNETDISHVPAAPVSPLR